MNIVLSLLISLLGIPIASFCTGSLPLGSPVEISNIETGFSPVDLSGTSSGYMATWADEDGNIWTSFSDNHGATWKYTQRIPYINSPGYSRIARGPLGTLVTYTEQTCGGASGTPSVTLSMDNGQSWSRASIAEFQITSYGMPICATDEGFLVTFLKYVDPHFEAQSAFSTDGITWPSENIKTLSITPTSPYFFPTSAYNGSIFMAAWVNNNGTALFNVSEDALIWGDPAQIGTVDHVNSQVTLTAVGSGFLATWGDLSGNAWSSFTSNNGADWTTPSQIASDLNTALFPTVLASGTSSTLISSWVGSDLTAYASLSNDLGTTWSAPTNVSSLGDYKDTLHFNLVGVSVVGNGYLFTWIDTENNIYSIGSPSSKREFKRPSNNRGF